MSAEHPDDGLPPLAPRCSLCGAGYHPNLEIDITDEPLESHETGDLEHRWCHVECDRDHKRDFVDTFGTDPDDVPVVEDDEDADELIEDLREQLDAGD